MKRILVLLNARAGTVLDCGPERVLRAFAALHDVGWTVDTHLVAPRRMPAAIIAAARSRHDAVVVGGGDGSASLAAQALAGTGKLLGVLPFGTMNLLARDLGMPGAVEAAVAALATARPSVMDLASVDGRLFHTLSGIGFFSQMARAREETRGFRLGRFFGVAAAAWRAMRRSGRFRFEVRTVGRCEEVEAFAVLVTNNRFDPAWRRRRLDEGVLKLHLAETAGALAKLRAGADLLTGAWRSNPGIRSITASAVTIAHVRRRAWTATDGELWRARVPLHYAIRPRALVVLKAQTAAQSARSGGPGELALDASGASGHRIGEPL